MERCRVIVKKIIDLSHDIIDQMLVHPYDDEVYLYQDKYLVEDKYNNFRLEIGMHTGTHIDTPMHLTEDNRYINEYPLERFIGNGCLLDVRNENIISYRQEYRNIVSENDIVLLFTNHSIKYGTEDYYTEHSVISGELSDFFIEKYIKMIGMDLPSPDT